jgi:Domain of unknown function (DUF4386)
VLLPLGSAGYLEAFTPAQLDAMTSLAIRSHAFGFGIALLLYGPFFLVSGYLIYRSTYFPRIIGVLYQIAGLASITNGCVLVLAPRFASQIFAAIVVPAFVGEASFSIWLLVKGPNMERWNACANARAPLSLGDQVPEPACSSETAAQSSNRCPVEPPVVPSSMASSEIPSADSPRQYPSAR